ncbi:ATPase [Lactococcus hodotermopsidis]|uniref:UDP-N-acetylglucosamine kinase n=1 Tax=Pseudolactococcus hodotermopsidis TaxID=2709157 RepID=A0A6A0BEH0_9LACT|nr:zeta toxin family protein [Lactococcus hodotermopsidis]GFH42728.1 ATPase [Lactococcus hodotermopsidis]
MLLEPTYTLIAGINGAGKSTFYSLDQGKNILTNSFRINPDEILREFGGDWRNFTDQAKSARLAVKMIEACISKEISFNQETTLSGNISSQIKKIKRAKENGFSIQLIYVSLESSDLAIKRIAERVKRNGHGIPDDLVRKRYEKSLENLKLILPYCDAIDIYDNTTSEGYKIVYSASELTVIDNTDAFPYVKNYIK